MNETIQEIAQQFGVYAERKRGIFCKTALPILCKAIEQLNSPVYRRSFRFASLSVRIK